MGDRGWMQIGEVAERTGLSLRTIRYYEEVKLLEPAARSQGGFRLYTPVDVERLHAIKRLKPLELTLDQTRELLQLTDRLAGRPRLSNAERARLVSALRGYQAAVRTRCEALRDQLATAEAVDATLAEHLDALAGERAGAGNAGATAAAGRR